MKVMPEVELPPEEYVYQKLMSDSTLTFADIDALELFNETYINLLLSADETTQRHKLAEILVRPSYLKVE